MISQYIKRGLRYILHGIPETIVKAEIHQSEPCNSLKNKKIIITGGGRGLGLAMAKKFIAEGAHVLISGRNASMLEAKAREIGAEWLVLDVTNAAEFNSFITEAASRLDGCDCLVNNAGISLHEGSILNVAEEQFDSQLSTNLKGSYFLAKEFIKYQIACGRKKSSILFVSSERGSYVDDLPYGITKAAINSLVQGLAYRYINEGIRVNAIAPGVTASDMTGFKEDGNLFCSYNLTGRIYLPSEVAEVAAFLLSDASACLNGQILVCNEGKSINAHWK